MPRQQRGLAECLRRGLVCFHIRVLVPTPHLQHIDALLTGHQVNEAAVQIAAQLLQLMLGIQRDHGFARLQQVADKQLHQIRFALPAVAEDEDIGGGLVTVAAVEVHHDVAAVFILADIKAVGICFAGVIERVQVGHAAGGQHTLELAPKGVITHETDAVKALLLPQEQLVHIQLAAHQLRQRIRLELPQMLHVVRRYLQIHGAVEQRLMLSVHLMHQLRHIPQVALGLHCLPQLVRIRAVQLVLLIGIVDDPVLLTGGHLPAIYPQRHAAFFAQVPQDGLRFGAGGVFPQRPYAAVGAAEDVMIHLELHHARRDAVEIGADEHFTRGGGFLMKRILHGHTSASVVSHRAPSTRSNTSWVTSCSK